MMEGYEKMRGGKPVTFWRDDALEAAAGIVEAYGADHQIAADIRAMKSATKPEPAGAQIETVPVPKVTRWTGGAAPEGAYGRVWLQIGDTPNEVEYVPAEPASAPSEGAKPKGEWLLARKYRPSAAGSYLCRWHANASEVSLLWDGQQWIGPSWDGTMRSPTTFGMGDDGAGDEWFATTSSALQESKAVTADGDFARMAEAEGATVDWGDHGSPPSFPSWGAWGRFCDAVRAIAPPSPVKEVTDQQIYDEWFALSEADNRVNEHVRLGGVLPFARAVLALAGGKRGGE